MAKVAEGLLSKQKLANFERQERNRKRNLGQPSSASNRIRKPSKAQSIDDREDAALDIPLGGGSTDDAKRAYGQW